MFDQLLEHADWHCASEVYKPVPVPGSKHPKIGSQTKVGVGGGVPAICHVLDAASQVNHLQSKQAYPCGGLACRLC